LYEKGGEAALIEMSRRVPNPKNRVAETIGAVGEVVGIRGWRNLRLVQAASTGVVAPGEITP